MALMGIESAHDYDDTANQIEQKLFEWKQELLQKYMVPALLRNKSKLLEEMIQAEKALSHGVQPALTEPPTTALPSTNRVDMLEGYESNLSALKLHLMRAPSFSVLPRVLDLLIELQENYMKVFSKLFGDYAEALPEEVNSREIIDTGKLLLALKQGDISEKTIWDIEREISRIKKIQGI